MNRKSKFITMVVVAMLIFGTLIATIGPKRFGIRNFQNQTEQCNKSDGVNTQHRRFDHENQNRNNNN